METVYVPNRKGGPVYMPPVVVADENLGLGDGERTEYAAAYSAIQPESLVIRVAGVVIAQGVYSVDSLGKITFTTPPEGSGSILASYRYGATETEVTGEIVGVGDGTTTTFNLANGDVIDGSLEILVAGLPTTAFSVNLLTGAITFEAPPSATSEIRVDYIAGHDSLFYKATSLAYILGLNIARSTDDPTDAAVSLRHNDVVLLQNKQIASGHAINPFFGYKPPLLPGDELHLTASDDGLVQAMLYVLEVQQA